jgi:hypothetical protein
MASFRAARRNRSDHGYAAIVTIPSDEPVRYTETRALPCGLRPIGRHTEQARLALVAASESRPPRRPPLSDPDATVQLEPIARSQLTIKRRPVDAPVRIPQCDERAQTPFVFAACAL